MCGAVWNALAHRRLVAARPAEADVAGRGLVQLRRALAPCAARASMTAGSGS